MQLALLSATPSVSFAEIQRVARALQQQLTKHFTPVWGRAATITAVERLSQVPPNVAPIIVKDQVGGATTYGYHRLDPRNLADPNDDQPFALVEYQRDWWPLDASHECLEMIVDPRGNAVHPAYDPLERGHTVSYLMEICDPCGRQYAFYPIDNVPVCDFYTPEWFEAAPRPGVRYSYQKRLPRPRSLLAGGYVSYFLPAPGGPAGSGTWYLTACDGVNYPTQAIAQPNIYSNLREWIDAASEPFLSQDAASPATRAALRDAAKTYRAARRNAAKVQHATARQWRRVFRAC